MATFCIAIWQALDIPDFHSRRNRESDQEKTVQYITDDFLYFLGINDVRASSVSMGCVPQHRTDNHISDPFVEAMMNGLHAVCLLAFLLPL